MTTKPDDTDDVFEEVTDEQIAEAERTNPKSETQLRMKPFCNVLGKSSGGPVHCTAALFNHRTTAHLRCELYSLPCCRLAEYRKIFVINMQKAVFLHPLANKY